eukprot:CAMPEP_0184479102 /NCGR_PEP_ID=MMETSP0113_2-20130426/945_1 /TAXON_ID=91329 /ORGANISM="Norrisiella sphaerica, Strain BC52" /LENGTH=218 /DNA_ID=CAMNT_0026857107 /DNA_START=497 /DNA_END=1152 /DNA_ORIENTATION=-
MRTHGRRAMKRALMLAEEQGEAEHLRFAMWMILVKRWEREINSPKKKKKDAKEAATPLSAKGKGKHNKQLENNMRFSFQNALKRHVLLKRARALFTLPCARADFIALFKGTFDVHEEGPRLVVDVSGADTAEVVRKLSPLVGENNDGGAGDAVATVRDVTVPASTPFPLSRLKNSVTFKWSMKTLSHVDANGETREVSMGKMTCTFPRNCTVVKGVKD